jgi:hypothetical protein
LNPERLSGSLRALLPDRSKAERHFGRSFMIPAAFKENVRHGGSKKKNLAIAA